MDSTAQLTQRVQALERQVGLLSALAGRLLTQNTSSSVDPASFYTADAPVQVFQTAAIHNGPMGLPASTPSQNGALILEAVWEAGVPAGGLSWFGAVANFMGNRYPVADGNTTSAFVFWDPTNPYILQGSNTAPIGANLFTVAANLTNTSGTLGQLSIVNAVMDTAGNITIQTGNSFIITSQNGHLAASIARTNASAAGIVSLADGTGAGSLGNGQRIIATGSDGKVQMATFQVNVANSSGGNTFPDFENMSGGAIAIPATSTDSLNITVGGTARKIPVI